MAGSAVFYGSESRVPRFAAQVSIAPSHRKHRTYELAAVSFPGLISIICARFAVLLCVLIHSSAVDPPLERRANSSLRGHGPFPSPPGCIIVPAVFSCRAPSGRAWSQP